MKNKIPLILAAIMISLLTGCVTTTQTALAPVGPDPAVQAGTDGNGQLEVYSAMVGFTTGNPAWYLHTDYDLCDEHGNPIQHVQNVVDYLDMEPRTISVPPGSYIVRAQAKDSPKVDVPVLVLAGRTTEVHLDDDWQPSGDYPKSDFVLLTSGHPVGWRLSGDYTK